MENTSENHPNEKNKNSKALLITIIGVLVALNAGLLYMWQKSGNEKQKTEQTPQTTKEDLSEKEAALADAEHMLKKFRLDSATMAAKNQTLNNDIITKKNEITALVAKLRSSNTKDAATIAELRQKMEELQDQIKKLESENAELKEKNHQLDEERTRLEGENKDLNNKYEEKSEENRINKAKAQALKTQNLMVEALKKRWITGKPAVTAKAKDVESIKTSFTIMENNDAESGERTIYIKITGPDGVTINNPGSEGGTFEFEGNESKYTYKMTAVFEKQSKAVQPTYWKPVNTLKPGKYTIELYCEGFKMGSSSLTLK